MRRVILLLATVLTSGQTSTQPYAGTWIAEFAGQTFVRLELNATSGGLGGQIGLGNIGVNSQGEVEEAGPVPGLTPIFEVTLADSVLSFSRKDGDDTDHFQLRLVGGAAELQFLLTEADRKELAEAGVPVPKPVRLRKLP
jgi:hypothetical protein